KKIIASKFAIWVIVIVAAVAVAITAIIFLGNSTTRNLVTRQALFTETIITGFREAANLITMNVDLEHSVQLAERGGFLWLGTREQTITFVGNGLFTTDLSVFTEDNIIIDSFRERVWVTIQRPVFYGVILDWDNTIVNDVTHNFFSWGEIELNPAESNELIRQAEVEMELLALQNLTNQAYEYTERAVTDLINTVLSAAGIGGYDIHILWN
ncbi:MAG: hypothetical protein FWB98_08865, partial [Defluviitaleaceae bacterium]|nr:hypothetical protein [Defluviitaleaceae bacterium]